LIAQKKLPARFHVSPTGRKPVREWILELPEADRHTVGKTFSKSNSGGLLGDRTARRSAPAFGRLAARSTAVALRGYFLHG
jgi:hypothetical protein